MQTEIEVKFVDIDIDDMRKRLQEAGATLAQPMRLMRRQVFYLVDRNKDAYVRVRDEGDKATMTYKWFDEIGLHGAKEVEVVVSSFEDARSILQNSGLVPKSYQETRRETWYLNEAEVVIDEWPWLRPFIEIEAGSEQIVRDAASVLGFDWSEAVFGAATEAYRQQYKDLPADFIMDDVPEIKFDAPLPGRLKEEV
ncbi:MAG TPA: class IV adenylate cyclase [Candidatus Saccharibacteria bacterium]|nr:class IV adenylate cyclase [Candidatus Saccharibacteria bacterium]